MISQHDLLFQPQSC